MSLTAEQIKKLVSAGFTAEQLSIVAEITEESVGKLRNELEERKQKERTRKRRSRDSHGTVTGQSRDADGTVRDKGTPSASPLSSPPIGFPTPLPLTPPIIPPSTTPAKGSPLRKVYTEDFEQFWKAYPANAASKAEAWKRYQRALQEGAVAGELLSAVAPYASYIAETETPPAHATTWLNQKRWTVNYAALPRKPQPPSANTSSGFTTLTEEDFKESPHAKHH